MNTLLEILFAEFNEELRTTPETIDEKAFERYLQRCPEPDRKQLTALMNMAYLARRRFASQVDQKVGARSRVAH